MMTSGISTKHIVLDCIRTSLDDYGYGDVIIRDDEAYSWVLYRQGNLVGRDYYDLENIIIQINP